MHEIIFIQMNSNQYTDLYKTTYSKPTNSISYNNISAICGHLSLLHNTIGYVIRDLITQLLKQPQKESQIAKLPAVQPPTTSATQIIKKLNQSKTPNIRDILMNKPQTQNCESVEQIDQIDENNEGNLLNKVQSRGQTRIEAVANEKIKQDIRKPKNTKKDDKKNKLMGVSCQQCQSYYRASGLDSQLCECSSRHRKQTIYSKIPSITQHFDF